MVIRLQRLIIRLKLSFLQPTLFQMCPGFVDTDMSSHKGVLTIDQGADTAVYLALLPPNAAEPKGQLMGERNVVDWSSYVFDFPTFSKIVSPYKP